jgi:hypothetical protein
MKTKTMIIATAIIAAAMSQAYAKERPATKAEISSKAVGHTINGRLWYGANGKYTFEGKNPGQYSISDGKICVKFDNGRSRCDRIVVDGAAYTLINKEGERYPWK